ncbi:tRNA selenocysteine 1-associated protein 1, partial [Lobosporangium transversale]
AGAGYCFVELSSPAAAAKAIANLNGVLIPGTNKTFKLNWATGGNMTSAVGSGVGANQEYSLFVGDLSPEVTEYILMATFQERYMTCRSAKIMTDPATGASRGYGFIRFGDEAEQQRALHEMQGVYCGSRPIRVSVATPKNKAPVLNMSASNMNGSMGMAPIGYAHTHGYMPLQPTSPQHTHTLNQYTDPNNTTVFVGGLSGITHEDELRNIFAAYGDITYVKIPPGKGCGFVQFVHRQSAEMAINQLNGYQIGSSRVRLSWGRAQNEPKPMSPHGPPVASSFRPPMHNQYGYGHNRATPSFGTFPGFVQSSMLPGLMQTQSSRDPMERIPVEHQNRIFMERKDALMTRMDEGASWRGSGAIYA